MARSTLSRAISRKLKLSVFAVTAALALWGAGSPAQAQQGSVTLKVASFQPENQAFSVAMKNWAADVTKASAGRLKFEFFWQGSLLGTTDIAPGVRDGRADIGFTGAVYIPARLPLSTIDSIPFMSKNIAAVGRAYTEMYQQSPEMQKEYDNSGFIMIGYLPAGANIFYSKHPLVGVADLKNLRIRTVGLSVEALKAAGANPIAIPQDQTYDSLSKGLLDATFGAGVDLGVDFSFHTLAPYMVDPNLGAWASGVYVMNKAAFTRLPEDLRNLITANSKDFTEKYYLPVLKSAEDDRCDKAVKDGGKVSVWPDSETDKWKALLGDAARQKWIASVNDKGADGAKFLAQYEAKVRDYEKTVPWTGAAQRCAARKS